jgi:hypothetical protein
VIAETITLTLKIGHAEAVRINVSPKHDSGASCRSRQQETCGASGFTA